MQKESIKRSFDGQVVSKSADKTVIVRVDTMKLHQKYKKYYKVSKRYPVHDEKNQAKMGDAVRFVETRPISKTKRWRLISTMKSSS